MVGTRTTQLRKLGQSAAKEIVRRAGTVAIRRSARLRDGSMGLQKLHRIDVIECVDLSESERDEESQMQGVVPKLILGSSTLVEKIGQSTGKHKAKESECEDGAHKGDTRAGLKLGGPTLVKKKVNITRKHKAKLCDVDLRKESCNVNIKYKSLYFASQKKNEQLLKENEEFRKGQVAPEATIEGNEHLLKEIHELHKDLAASEAKNKGFIQSKHLCLALVDNLRSVIAASHVGLAAEDRENISSGAMIVKCTAGDVAPKPEPEKKKRGRPFKKKNEQLLKENEEFRKGQVVPEARIEGNEHLLKEIHELRKDLAASEAKNKGLIESNHLCLALVNNLRGVIAASYVGLPAEDTENISSGAMIVKCTASDVAPKPEPEKKKRGRPFKKKI